ncbi:MAG: hypothetical protein AAF098_19145, partial [Pseudomonadota bacterium]
HIRRAAARNSQQSRRCKKAFRPQPGVVIHFEADAGLGLYEGGTLTAGGTAERPITLRGTKDQSGFWRGIHSEGSLALRHVRIANAGGNYVYCCNSPAAVFARSGSVVLEQVEFTQLESCEVYARQRVDLTIDGQRNSKLDERDICTGGGYLPADVNQGTRLVATEREVDYFVKAGQVVNITKSLTIDPGVVIEFEENAGLGVYDAGVLNAQGTEDRPIVLRGKEDRPGYWRGIHTESQTLLEHVEVKNAGSTYVYCCNDAAGIFAKGGSLNIKNSALIRNQGCALSATTSTELSIQDNRFENNEADVCADPVPLPTSIKEDTVLRRSGREVDYYAPDNQVTNITAKLSIEAGVTIEMGQNSGLGVYDTGSLLAQGDQDQPIVFKGKEDRPGYWRGIHTESQALLEHIELKNAGSTYVYCCNGAAGILGKGGSLALINSALTGNQGCALSATTFTNLSVQDSRFENNEADVCADPVPLPASIQEDTVLRRSGREVDYYVPDDQVTDITAKLSIEAGVTIEMGRNSGLGFYDAGTLQAKGTTEEPIAIRGKQDQIGYWRGIYSEKSLVLKHAQISNAGRDYVYCCNQPAAIFARSGSVALESVEFAKQQSCEVYARQRVDLLINGERNSSLEQQDICTAGGYLPSDIRRSTLLIDTDSEVDYIVKAGQIVNVTQALTIDPGVVIEFEENAGLGVYDTGALYAQGTVDNPIVLKGAEDRPGYWRGIHTETDATLEHVEISNAGSTYVYCCHQSAAVYAKRGSLTAKANLFRSNDNCALFASDDVNLLAADNRFENHSGDPLCPAGLTQMASEQKTVPEEQSANQLASSAAGSRATTGGDLTKTTRKMADAVKTPGSLDRGPKMRRCQKIYRCYAKQDVRNAIRDLSYRVTPGDPEFCEQLWGWFGNADCASDEQLKIANYSFGIIHENDWLRCDPLENYLKELKQRWDSGEDTQEAEKQLEAAYLKAFGSFLGAGGPEAFCEAIMEGVG